ncbi:MAG TPA: RebB family R body protein [Acetobacteraceae bacterium]|nr:RebB family R body protein [Acetobacteraceae bacterium]
MPPETSPEPNGTAGAGFALSGLTAEVLGPAPSQAVAVIYSQMAHAVGLAMQNIVAQQQTLNTINNAIATKALNLLADTNPQAALEEIRKQFSATTNETVGGLSTLARLVPGQAPPAPTGQGGEAHGGEGSKPQEPPQEPPPAGGGHTG